MDAGVVSETEKLLTEKSVITDTGDILCTSFKLRRMPTKTTKKGLSEYEPCSEALNGAPLVSVICNIRISFFSAL